MQKSNAYAKIKCICKPMMFRSLIVLPYCFRYYPRATFFHIKYQIEIERTLNIAPLPPSPGLRT